MKTLEIKSLQEIDDLIIKKKCLDNMPRHIFQTWRSLKVSPQVFDRVKKMRQDNSFNSVKKQEGICLY